MNDLLYGLLIVFLIVTLIGLVLTTGSPRMFVIGAGVILLGILGVLASAVLIVMTPVTL